VGLVFAVDYVLASASTLLPYGWELPSCSKTIKLLKPYSPMWA